MASINPQNDPNNPQQPGGQQISTGGSGGAASSNTGPAASQPVSPVQQNQAPQQTSNFNDVSAYLNANQQGGTQLGQQAAQNVTNKYQSTLGGINQSANSANQAVNSGYVPENTQLIQQVASNPTAAAADQGQLSAFQGQLNDQYSGPSNWADLGTQQGNVANAQQYGNLINTPGGANVLTQEVENQLNPGQSSQGVNQLDTLLLQGNPGAVGAVQTAAQPYNSLTDYLNSQNTGIQNNITGAQTAANQTAQDALNAFTGQNGTLTNLNNTINTTTANDLSAAQAQQAQLKADIANLYGGTAQNNTPGTIQGFGAGNVMPWYNTQNYNVGNLSPQDLASLGVTSDQWNALQSQLQQAGTTQDLASNFANSPQHFGANTPTSQYDIGQFLNQQDPTQMVQAGTVATPEQYQQMAAIQQLLGGKTPQGNTINPALSSLAGTYNPNSLNQFDYNAALQGATGLASAEHQAGQNEANAIEQNANAQHQAGLGGGFFGGINHFLNQVPGVDLAAKYLANPLSVVPEELNPQQALKNEESKVK